MSWLDGIGELPLALNDLADVLRRQDGTRHAGSLSEDLRGTAVEMLSLAEARDGAPGLFVLEFDDREPAGPMLIGPFLSRQHAFEYAADLELSSASYAAIPLAAPAATSSP